MLSRIGRARPQVRTARPAATPVALSALAAVMTAAAVTAAALTAAPAIAAPHGGSPSPWPSASPSPGASPSHPGSPSPSASGSPSPSTSGSPSTGAPGEGFLDLTPRGGESRAVRLAPGGALVGNWAPVPDGTFTGFVRLPSGVLRALGPLGPHAQALNDQGDAVGCTAGGTGLYWHDGTLTYLVRPGLSSCLYAINDAGQIAGASAAPGGGEKAFVWKDGVYTDLETAPGQASTPIAINERGQVLARVFGDRTSIPVRAVVWTDGSPTDLGTLGGAQTIPAALGTDGAVVGISEVPGGGSHPFRWAHGRMTDLLAGTGVDDRNAQAAGLDTAGDVVGTVSSRPALWRNGELTYLADAGEATAINEAGQVTGVVREGPDGRPTVFRWTDGDLARLPNPADASYCYAVGIDRTGTVVGNVAVGPVGHAVVWPSA
ncbi:hypothetical protein [Cryptosporangium sp. NPDC051539]|uniref:hypothetical protein n=1 Tax=Cryptosporangium sp. NPDC051539 TaxID=3363962 RepID=UPI00379D095A